MVHCSSKEILRIKTNACSRDSPEHDSVRMAAARRWKRQCWTQWCGESRKRPIDCPGQPARVINSFCSTPLKPSNRSRPPSTPKSLTSGTPQSPNRAHHREMNKPLHPSSLITQATNRNRRSDRSEAATRHGHRSGIPRGQNRMRDKINNPDQQQSQGRRSRKGDQPDENALLAA